MQSPRHYVFNCLIFVQLVLKAHSWLQKISSALLIIHRNKPNNGLARVLHLQFRAEYHCLLSADNKKTNLAFIFCTSRRTIVDFRL